MANLCRRSDPRAPSASAHYAPKPTGHAWTRPTTTAGAHLDTCIRSDAAFVHSVDLEHYGLGPSADCHACAGGART